MRNAVWAIYICAYLAIMAEWGISEPHVSQSALWMVDQAISPLIIMGPLLSGIAAVDSYILRSLGYGDLVEALPASAQMRLYARRGVNDVLMAMSALGIALVIGQFVSAHNNSFIVDPSVLWVLLPTIGMVVFFALGGRFLGLLFPYALIGPAAAIGAYCLMAFLPDNFHLHFGFTAETVVVYHRFLPLNSTYVGAIYAAIGVSLMAIWGARIVGGKLLILFPTFAVVSLICVYMAVPRDFYFIRNADTYEQSCEQVKAHNGIEGVELMICVPRDQERDLGLVVQNTMDVLLQYSSLELPEPPTRYAFGVEGAWIDLPFGLQSREEWQLPAQLLDRVACFPDLTAIGQASGENEQLEKWAESYTAVEDWLKRDPKHAQIGEAERLKLKYSVEELTSCL